MSKVMKFKFKKVLTFEEYKKAANRFWYKDTWLAKVLKERFLDCYAEQYIVDYSFADDNGFWGQRTTLDFKAKDKKSHDDVENYFHILMKNKQLQKEISEYRIHSISVA